MSNNIVPIFSIGDEVLFFDEKTNEEKKYIIKNICVALTASGVWEPVVIWDNDDVTPMDMFMELIRGLILYKSEHKYLARLPKKDKECLVKYINQSNHEIAS